MAYFKSVAKIISDLVIVFKLKWIRFIIATSVIK